ncbi:BCCT family betaine/carnitine transporter [Melghirimyces profundicolus]|uniref:BCCT family betaine/carnitine transporter n=1 Tax=Melghirimyces profundicolus TaxID=1242148 RepID=A0A2T6C9I8_9BACL|nr:BCCT family transporter [Melghirimyces profundicolus]PTX64971.1 BCCT family betaine/carnitine transporter [Melghirimyces profundicolus]
MNATQLDGKVFWGSLLVVGLLIAPLTLGTDRGVALLNTVREGITRDLGWFYLWFAAAALGLLAWLALGRYGNVRFGGESARPEFSRMSWIAMIFTAGIGSSLMYWGMIEWAYYYSSPPFGLKAESPQAGQWAATYGLFHWGFSAWAIYCLPAVVIAYAFHQKGYRILNLSRACRGVLGKQADGWLGKVIDIFFIFGMVGGVGTTLGLGTPMIAEGISTLTGISPGLGLNTGIILAWTALFGASAYLGLKKGIKRLSDLNLYLGIGVGIFILLTGPTLFILDTFTNSFGLLVQNFFRMSFYMDSVGGGDFTRSWTVFYWAWWVAYAPFIGLFTARISRGRTIRELILAMVLAGSSGCWIAFALLGNTGLFFELKETVPVTRILNETGAPAAIIAILQALPGGSLLLIAFLTLAMVFLATTLDSSAYTLARVTSREMEADEEPARWLRIFWALILGGIAVAMMAGGGLEPLQNLTIITSVPVLVILTLMTLSLLKWLAGDEKIQMETPKPQKKSA